MLPSLARCVLVSRAFDCVVLDGVHLDFRDTESFGRVCKQGRDLGFDGKTLIHPSQVDVANATFGPSADEIDQARLIVAAWADAQRAGKGVAVSERPAGRKSARGGSRTRARVRRGVRRAGPDGYFSRRAHARHHFLDVRIQRFRIPRRAQRDVHFGGTCRDVFENAIGSPAPAYRAARRRRCVSRPRPSPSSSVPTRRRRLFRRSRD